MNAVFDPRSELQRLAGEYQQRASAIRRDLTSGHAHSFTEQACERQNDDVLHNLLAEAEQGLLEVQQALQRLDAGNYGECCGCGEPIAPARLAALPAAGFCLRCASAAPHH